MQRNQRATRNNQVNRQFVAGGVISNFTGVGPEPVPLQSAQSIIQVNLKEPASIAAQLVEQSQLQEQQQEPEPIKTELTMDQGDENEKADDASANGSLKRRFNRPQLSKKVKRLRRNRRLRKILMPKNALMSLHELLGAGLSEFNVVPEERGFVATVFANNAQYEGRGISKMAAKNNASEKALRDIIIQRMAQSPRGTALKTVNDPQQQTNTDDLFHDDVDMVDNGDGDDKADDESEVPMMHLASFALHKLFSEWQAEGFEIPDFKAGALPAAAGAGAPLESMLVDKPAKQAGTPTNRSQVPEDAAAMHPTTLLNNMRPGTKYVDLGSEGQVPNTLHRAGVEVDGEHFVGSAKSKKLARKFAAIEACNRFFNTAFIKDEN